MLLETDIEDEILDDDFIEEEQEQDQTVEDITTGIFIENIRVLAREYINRFFQVQEMYCGGKIPTSFFLTEENISMVMNTSLEDGVRRSYEIIEQDGRYKSEAIDSLVPEDVKLLISIMNKCSKLGVPKEFVPGIVLIYLEHCEGMKVAI